MGNASKTNDSLPQENAPRAAADYRDLMIEELIDSEAELLARVADLEADVASYRELAQQALHSLHYLTCERDRLVQRLRVLHDELHALRALERNAA
jgi:hypothetical protein